MTGNELSELSQHMKQAVEGEGGESLTKISLAISILAVLVAMVTVMGHRTHTHAILYQVRAADQWNIYQTRKIQSDETLGRIVCYPYSQTQMRLALRTKLWSIENV